MPISNEPFGDNYERQSWGFFVPFSTISNELELNSSPFALTCHEAILAVALSSDFHDQSADVCIRNGDSSLGEGRLQRRGVSNLRSGNWWVVISHGVVYLSSAAP